MHCACVHPINISIKCPFATICCDRQVEVKHIFESKSKLMLLHVITAQKEGTSMSLSTKHAGACFLHDKIRFVSNFPKLKHH